MTETVDFAAYGLRIPETNKPRVIIVGGGFGGINAIRKLPAHQFQVVLFDRHNYHTFIPLLYQVATSALDAPSVADAQRRLFQDRRDVHFRPLKILAVKPEQQEVVTAIGELSYDYLIIASGAKTNFFGNKRIEKESFPLRTLPNAVDMRSKLLQNMERANLAHDSVERSRLMNFVIVGGGPTGVEMAGALAELRKYVFPKDYQNLKTEEMSIKIVEGGSRLLNGMSENAGEDALRYLHDMGVEVKFNTLVDDMQDGTIIYKDGKKEQCGMLIWSAGVAGQLIEGIPPENVHKGQYLVDGKCRIQPYSHIFAIGDVAYFEDERFDNGLPGVAQTAIQQGKYVGKLITGLQKGKEEPDDFRYTDKGSLATIGRNKAVADLPVKIRFSGFLAWAIWAFVHLFAISSFRNRIITFANWIINYVGLDKKVRIIIRPAFEKGDRVDKAMAVVNDQDG